MKKIYFFVIIYFGLLFCITADEIFNYYSRNTDGSFVIEKLQNEYGIPFFEYKVSYDSNGNIIKVTGFYYGTNRIKFIDVIENNKILSTTYYDFKTGNIIYTKKNNYKENKITSIVIELIMDFSSVKRNYKRKIIFGYIDEKIISFTSHCVDKVEGFLHGSGQVWKKTIIDSEGMLYSLMMPKVFQSIINLTSSEGCFNAKAKSIFKYDNKNLVLHEVVDLEREVVVYRKTKSYINYSISETNEEIYDFFGNFQHSINKKYLDGKIYETTLFKSGSRTERINQVKHIRKDLYKIYMVHDSLRTSFILENQDERVIFDIRDGKVIPQTSILRYNFDVISNTPYSSGILGSRSVRINEYIYWDSIPLETQTWIRR